MRVLYVFVCGLCMAVAELIPGVSGSTIALVFGLYDSFVAAIIASVRALLSARNGLKAFRLAFFDLPWSFMLPLGAGTLIGGFSFALLIQYLLTHYQRQLFFFFFGAVLAAALIVFFESKRTLPWRMILAWGGLGLLIGVGVPAVGNLTSALGIHFGSDEGSLGADFLVMLIAGGVGSFFMLLPGISGSYVLLSLGLYAVVISHITHLHMHALFGFALGVLLGLSACSFLLQWLKAKYEEPLAYGLSGLILGSSWTLPFAALKGTSEGSPWMLPLYFCIGAVLILLSHRLAQGARKNSSRAVDFRSF